ncbi:unnamed protein product [Spirodela intermedia]|uniref:DUF4219 domain-containing protein n=2 Tax=Spirodela intermedia TaxID=51605 RepID=A0A7I8KDF9_SPIIN|nr:unnamed protein product [Spirodela intermedia]CAA6659238.1 unnamed protein product [Spirodela intermedia]CAA6675840.1 unnamed protein product [Spirodela intermedia]CAA7395552.1 unnamed protein product [Spirodela intermedia]
MPHRGDATESESSLAASGAAKGPGDTNYPGTFPVLNKTNYPLWAMRMQLHLEAHSLWDAIESDSVARKKDQQALSKMWDLLRFMKRNSEIGKSEKKNKFFSLTGLRKQRVEILVVEDVAEVGGVAETDDKAMGVARMKTGRLVTNPQ